MRYSLFTVPSRLLIGEISRLFELPVLWLLLLLLLLLLGLQKKERLSELENCFAADLYEVYSFI